MLSQVKRGAVAVLAGAAIAACDDGTGPQGPARIEVVEAPAQVTAGKTAELAIRVVRGSSPARNVEVRFEPREGAGRVSAPRLRTGADGMAVTTWLAGTVAGTQRIAVQADEAEEVIEVAVVPDEPFAIRLAQDSARLFALRAETSFEAEVVDRWGNAIPGLPITWESLDPAVAEVEPDGTVRALRVGTAEIVARYGGLSASLFLRVVQAPARIEVTPEAITINALTFTRSLELRSWDELDNPIPRPEADWVSLDESIATVDGEGVVTATGVGTTLIVANAGAASDTVTVTVRQVQVSAVLVAEPERVYAGEVMTVTAVARDSADQPIPGVAVEWTMDGDLDAFTVLEEGEDRLVLRGEAVGALLVSAAPGGMPAEFTAQVILPRRMSNQRVAAGSGHTLFIRDGQVYALGENSFGQVGDGTTFDRYAPYALPGMTGFVAVAAGTDFSLALREDGTVWAWGRNTHGQLGLGDLENRTVPVQIPGIDDAIAIAAGGSSTTGFSLILRADGTVWATGDNGSGQLGLGDTVDRMVPERVPGLDGVVAIAAGSSSHALALREDGTMWGWGTGTSGRLGNGLSSTQTLPSQGLLRRVVAIASGTSHGQALTYDGRVWGFGSNTFGQTGTGATAVIPAEVSGLRDVVAIRASGNTSFALTANGQLYGWGSGSGGQMGNGTTTSTNSTPVLVHLSNARLFATGGDHVLAEDAAGVLWAWGRNGSGQLGTGDLTTRTEPAQVRFVEWSPWRRR